MNLVIRRTTIVVLGIALVSFVGLGMGAYINLRRFQQASDWVSHTQAIQISIRLVLSSLQDIETGQRGYLLTGDSAYLDPYYAALPAIDQQVAVLRQFTADNPRQQERLTTLQPLITQKLAVTAERITLRTRQGPVAIEALAEDQRGRLLMDEIRAVIGEMEREELRLLVERSALKPLIVRQTIAFSLLGTLVGLTSFGMSVWLINEDIRSQKQAEQALRQSEEKFRQIAENVGEVFFSYALNTRQLLYVNPAYEVIWGRPMADLYRYPLAWLRAIHADDRAQAIADLRGQQHGQAIHQEYRLHRPDGSLGWVSVRTFLLRPDPTGPITHLIGLAADVSDRKAAELALQAANQALEAKVAERTAALQQQTEFAERLIQHCPVGIAAYDRNGCYTAWNPMMAEITGVDRAEVIGQPIFDVFPFLREMGEEKYIQAALAGEMTILTAHPIADPDRGRQGIYAITHMPLKDDAGNVTGGLALFRNITQQYELDKMKDEFVSVVSHELRTPLTSMRFSLDAIAQGRVSLETARGQKTLEIAINSTEHLIRLVNDILNVERWASGQVALQKEPCDLQALITQAVEQTQAIADEAGITLTVATPSIPITVDPHCILEVLTNLLSNAIKFSPAGTTVWLRADLVPATATATAEALITVQDQGRGIPADKLNLIFERFQQVEAADRRQKGGTGLGLTIVRSIVQLHGGRIWVESIPGTGSCFYVSLPLS